MAIRADSDNNGRAIPITQVNAMNFLKTATATALAALLLAGCSQEEKTEGVIPEAYKSAVDKAAGVENTLNDAMQLQDQAIEQSEAR